MTQGPLQVALTRRDGRVLATATGGLDLASYPHLRDGLLKAAADAPDGLVADISGLAIHEPSLVSVFALVAMRIADWPAVPFGVVSARPEHRALLRTRAVGRFVRVSADQAAAVAALDRPVRRRAQREIPRSDRAGALARAFVERICAEWAVPALGADAAIVATELVENTMRHTESTPRLRVDLYRGRYTVAVADDDPAPAFLRENAGLAAAGLGLRMVAQLSRVWGSSSVRAGGKVVWAVLSASGPVTE